MVLRGFEGQNVNSKNERETCLQIAAYVGLKISFLYSNYTNDGNCHGYSSVQNMKSSSDQKIKKFSEFCSQTVT